MATRDSNGAERRRARLDGNRPRTHPKHSGRKATKVRPRSSERDECPKDGDTLDSDALGRFFRTHAGWLADHNARVDGQQRTEGEP